MNLKIVVAVLLFDALAQSPSTAKVNKGDAQKVVTIISGDKAKTQTYCEMQKLAAQPSVPNTQHCLRGLRTL